MSELPSNPPPLSLWGAELLAVPKVLAAPFRQPTVHEPFGLGRPALVIPGMLSGDRSTSLLRASLSAAGFDAHGWGQSFNVRVSIEVVEQLERKLATIASNAGQPVVILGWSLGGMYARLLAQRQPGNVALVITLGSPFSGDRRANNAWRIYERLNDHSVDAPPFSEDVGIKPPVRTIAVWSERDGIVSPASACGTSEQSDRQVQLSYRHFELGASRPAINAVLGILRSELA